VRRVILTWLGFAALWALVHALASVLAWRHLEITYAATWTATLVPLVQAVVIESLARPFGLAMRLRRIGALARRPAVAVLWVLAVVIAVGAVLFLSRPVAVLGTLGAVLATAAAIGLAVRTPSLGAARAPALGLAALVLALASQRLTPWLITLPPRLLPGLPPRLVRLVAFVLVVAALFSLLFTLARELAPRAPESSDLLAAAAGITTLGLLVAGVPLLLGAPLVVGAAALSALLLTAAATALASTVLALPR